MFLKGVTINRDAFLFQIISLDCQTTILNNWAMSMTQQERTARYRARNIEKIRARDREIQRNKFAAMSPEELEQARKEKAEYDLKYREENKSKRDAYKKDPENIARWNLMRKEKYRANNPIPVRLTEEQKAERRRMSAIQDKIKNPNRSKDYYRKNLSRMSEYHSDYYQKNKPRIKSVKRIYKKKRRDEDPGIRIKMAYYTRVSKLMHGKTKSKRTQALLGCNREQLKDHLESQFQKGMTWENYGRNGWHMDHRIPCASFDLTDPIQQAKCFHYTNLQPLWAIDNIRKNDKVPAPKMVQQLLV